VEVGDPPGDFAQRPGGQDLFKPALEFGQRQTAVGDGGAQDFGRDVTVRVRRP
jgi:hypothetical protein